MHACTTPSSAAPRDMRASMEQRLNRIWYGERRPSPVLLALEPIYRCVTAVARRVNTRRRASDLEGKAILVVGNLTAGGTGKTPLVIRLCELAAAQGLRAGVASRGYGRESRQPMWVEAATDPDKAGDEPVLIASRTGVPVRVDARRERAVRALFERGVDLVILDDGLQRAQLPRALEICVVDAARGFGNGHLLPAGPLRESTARLDQIDYVVEHGSGTTQPVPGRYRMRLEPGPFRSLQGEEALSAAALRDRKRPVHAVAGIARPERFFETLAALGIEATRLPFPDHHRFLRTDFEGISGEAIIVMTEKDAVKCRALGLEDAWFLPVSAVLEDDLEAALVRDMRQWIRQEGAA